MRELERIELERKKFEELGISEGVPFELVELKGHYIIDIPTRGCYSIDIRHHTGRYGLYSTSLPVEGLYDHILDGTWRKL